MGEYLPKDTLTQPLVGSVEDSIGQFRYPLRRSFEQKLLIISLQLQSMEKLIRKGNKIIPKASENIITACLNKEGTNLSTHQHQYSVCKCRSKSASNGEQKA